METLIYRHGEVSVTALPDGSLIITGGTLSRINGIAMRNAIETYYSMRLRAVMDGRPVIQ